MLLEIVECSDVVVDGDGLAGGDGDEVTVSLEVGAQLQERQPR